MSESGYELDIKRCRFGVAEVPIAEVEASPHCSPHRPPRLSASAAGSRRAPRRQPRE